MTRNAHLTTESPNPEIAPARPAIVTVRQHKAEKSPIQLNRRATETTTQQLQHVVNYVYIQIMNIFTHENSESADHELHSCKHVISSHWASI